VLCLSAAVFLFVSGLCYCCCFLRVCFVACYVTAFFLLAYLFVLFCAVIAVVCIRAEAVIGHWLLTPAHKYIKIVFNYH
jgi:hypothetical protein